MHPRVFRSVYLTGSFVLGMLAWAPASLAQRGARPEEVEHARHLIAPQLGLYEPGAGATSPRSDSLNAGSRPAILLTGYWPPTNEMIRHFSTDPVQNPGGWMGSDWEGRGYDVYSYFPEFSPPDCDSCGQGSGDLEVDYQDTSADYWSIADGIDPIAIITFSRGFDNFDWEVEMNQYNLPVWVPDYTPPLQPTPAPPDSGYPSDGLRISKHPVQEIVDAVDALSLGLTPRVCYTRAGGGFLSEFVAYHGVWYQGLHADPAASDWCVAAGHVHVGQQVSWSTATLAAEETLRTVIGYVDSVLGCAGWSVYCDGAPNSFGAGARIDAAGSTSIVTNVLKLEISGAVPSSFGLFYYGAGKTRLSFGNGLQCVQGALFRLGPPILIDSLGNVERILDMSVPPLSAGAGQVTPGSFWQFQFYYRDQAGGGARFNTSDAVSIMFCP